MKKKQLQKKTLILLSAIGLVIVTIGLLIFRGGSASSNDVQTYTVREEVFENVIEISGTVEAAQSQALQIAGEGTVEAVYVSEGEYVTEGTVLLELNTSQAEYNLAQLDYNLQQSRINGSAKEIELMEKEREMRLDDLEDRQVIATFDGIIAELDVSEGDVFEAKDEVGTLINREYLKATIEIVETDVSRLSIGQEVSLSFPAYSDGNIIGEVVSWPSVAYITSSGASVVDVEVHIYDPPQEILPSFSFIGEIIISPPEILLLVERQAIKRQEGQTFVDVIMSNGSLVNTSVQTAQYNTNYIRILDGVQAGDVLKAQEVSPSGANARSGIQALREANGQEGAAPTGGGGGGGGGGPRQ